MLPTMHSPLSFSISTSNGKLHPIAFHSRTFSALELNYDVHDKELLGFLKPSNDGDTTWKALDSRSTWSPITRTCNTFQTTKILTRRQAQWSEYLSGFNLIIRFRPRKLGTKPDALTRQFDVYLKEGIATMPVLIHRTSTWYSLPSNWHRPSELLPSQSQSSMDLSLWMLKASLRHPISTSRGSYLSRTPRQTVRLVDPRP